MIKLCTDGNLDIRTIISSLYMKTDTQYKYILSQAMKCRINKIIIQKSLDRSKIDEISNLFVKTRWSLVMINQLLKFITDNKSDTSIEQFLKFAIDNGFDERLTLFLKNKLIRNPKKEKYSLQQFKNLMVYV